jgi:outer membrane protein assembly factor BamB
MIITAGTAAFGCVSGVTAIGWSGGAVSDNTIYVGSREGRLVVLNLADDSRRWSKTIKVPAQGGFLGCGTSMGGCGGSASSGLAIYGTPVVSGGLVYMAAYNGKIYAYDKNEFNKPASSEIEPLWSYPLDDYLKDEKGKAVSIVGGLVVSQGGLYFGGSDGKIYAIDAITHKELWESPFKTNDKIWSTPAIDDNTLYIGSFDKKLYAIDIATGKEKWEKPFETQGAIMATPLVDNGVVYIGSLDRNLYAISAADGKPKWNVPVTGENWFWSEPVVWNGNIYAGCLDGKVYIVKADTGAQVATLDLKGPLASKPVIVGDSVIFATRKGVIYSINTATNQATQLADIKLEVDGPLTARQGIVYIHTQDIALQRVNAASGAILPPISLKKP